MGDVIFVDFVKKIVTGRLTTIKDTKAIQEENNERVIEKMEKGDNLCTSTLKDSWFPARGIFDRKLGRMVPSKE